MRNTGGIVDTQGTDALLGIAREFCLIHFSEQLSLSDRIESASYCMNMLRYWRNHVDSSKDLKLTSNFLARQTYEVRCCQTSVVVTSPAHNCNTLLSITTTNPRT